jgi:sec-independent protein translocase protein TatB
VKSDINGVKSDLSEVASAADLKAKRDDITPPAASTPVQAKQTYAIDMDAT